jgi:hypothetical protein
LLSPTESLSTKLEVGFQSALKPYLPWKIDCALKSSV